jgi:hypothetical protein
LFFEYRGLSIYPTECGDLSYQKLYTEIKKHNAVCRAIAVCGFVPGVQHADYGMLGT